MPDETLKEALSDIRAKLLAGDFYQNEEHIRFSLVARVLKALGWDIWNPKEVYTECPAVPTEDKGKVDIGLLINNRHQVFIEIKPIGYWSTYHKLLTETETQLENYLRKFSAPFGLITDGRIWRFYLTYTPASSLGEKLFQEFDFIAVIDESDLFFILSKEAIEDGSTRKLAEERLKATERSRQIRQLIPDAENFVKKYPTNSPVQALQKLVREKFGYDVTIEEAVEAINAGIPKDQPPISPPIQTRTISSNQENKDEQTKEKPLKKDGGYIGKNFTEFTLFGESYIINRQYELLVKVAEIIFNKHPNDFEKVFRIRGHRDNITYFSYNGRDLEAPKRIGNSRFWIRTKFTGDGTVGLAKRILSEFGYRQEDLIVQTK